MIRTMLNWIEGYRRIHADPAFSADALNLLQKNRYIHWNMKTDADGTISFTMLKRQAHEFLKACEQERITVRADTLKGLPRCTEKYAGRWGLPIGAVLFAWIVWMSTTVVWSIEIRGNESLSEDEIRVILRENGFGEGVRWKDIDFELFQNDIPLNTDQISWIAVNMLGTTAHVEIRESQNKEARSEDGHANIVAAEDGQIVELLVSGGRPAVGIHDVVRKGDLLISGIMTIRGDTLRFEHASGRVLAQVHRQITAEVPLNREENVYTGAEFIKKSAIIFGKEIKLFQNGGFEGATYDTIIENIQLTLPGEIELPIWIRTETRREYSAETVTLSDAEAYEEAEKDFRKAVEDILTEAEILSLESTAVLEDGVCRITGDAVCITDIAKTQEIPVS